MRPSQLPPNRSQLSPDKSQVPPDNPQLHPGQLSLAEIAEQLTYHHRMRQEAIIPVYTRITAGHFTETSEYSTYRTNGTDDWLLIHTINGAGLFGTETEAAYGAAPGQTTLIAPGVRHDYRTDPAVAHWEFYFAHFAARYDWRSLLDWPELSPGLHQLSLDGDARCQVETNLADAVVWSHRLLRHSGLLGLNRLEAALLWCDLANPLSQSVDERVRLVIDAVEQDIARPWTLRTLAEVAGLSPSRISHLFHEHLGVGPMTFVEERRMAFAAQLLDLTSLPIGAVAAKASYQDPLHFSARFRARFQMSPTAYRRRPVPVDDPS